MQDDDKDAKSIGSGMKAGMGATEPTNTEESFRSKWDNNPDLAFSETLREGSDIFQWILNRNGFAGPGAFAEFLATKKRILDAGCGNGRVTALLRKYSSPATTSIMGIDLVSSEIARKNLEGAPNVEFKAKDLLADLADLGQFDFIYCQEVLHHTRDPYNAFLNLVGRLAPGGEIAIYVYKKKAPVREYVDDYVRASISGMDYATAMNVCAQITSLGKILSELKLKVHIPQVDVLDIEEGEYDIQRFVYHFFMKCFWNPDLSESDNVAINYDWYHPQDCTRHTQEEITGWFESAGLLVSHSFTDFYGITIRGLKQGASPIQ